MPRAENRWLNKKSLFAKYLGRILLPDRENYIFCSYLSSFYVHSPITNVQIFPELSELEFKETVQ